MKIEKHTKGKPRQSDGMIASILKLKPDSDECLRLTTARQGRNISGMWSNLKVRYKLNIVLKTDGDDILLWTEKLK